MRGLGWGGEERMHKSVRGAQEVCVGEVVRCISEA